MCIYSKTLPKKSRKVRTCYKVLWLFYSAYKGKYILASPYALQKMQKHVKAGFFEDNRKLDIQNDVFHNLYIFGKGLIHTYENYEDALNVAVKLSFWNLGYMIIYKCQIPKDTKYCYGPKKYNIYPQYASKRINFVEDVGIVKCGTFNNKILKKGSSEYEEIINRIKQMK